MNNTPTFTDVRDKAVSIFKQIVNALSPHKPTAPTVAAETNEVLDRIKNRHRVREAEQDAKIDAINQARDEAVASLKAEADEIVARMRVAGAIVPLKDRASVEYFSDDVIKYTRPDGQVILIKQDDPISTIITEDDGVTKITPNEVNRSPKLSKRKPKGSGQ